MGRYYDEVIFDAEIGRLGDLFPIEFAMTTRYIERYAARECRLHLLDVSRKLLDAVRARVTAASACHGSATDLPFADDSCDAVLMLGPLYHLTRMEDRRRAVAEAARVLSAPKQLAKIGEAEQAPARRVFHAQYLRDGVLNPEVAPPIGHAHFSTRDEFGALFPRPFKEIKLVAVESFAAPWQAQFKALSPEVADAWLDLIEQTAETPEAFGLTDHFLYIGRKT